MRAVRIFVFLIASLLLVSLSSCAYAEPGISVQTDKTKYFSGKEISINISNNSQQSIYSIAASSTPSFAIEYIEKQFSDGTWEKLQVRCQYPECDIDFDFPGELSAGKSVRFIWNPEMHIKGEGVKNRPLTPGKYQIVVGYQLREGSDSRDWKGFSAVSNEFIIE